jgi:hypothetical protein
MLTLGAVVTLAAFGIAHLRSPQPCRAAYPVDLQIPAQTGGSFGVTMKANCTLDPDRTYLLVEEIPNVDPKNPHPVYFVKAELSPMKSGGNTSAQLLIKEPVGTRAEFFVISVDPAGNRALGQNRVVDDGALQLPEGHRQESAVMWHERGWS